jgi:hypothetical protein
VERNEVGGSARKMKKPQIVLRRVTMTSLETPYLDRLPTPLPQLRMVVVGTPGELITAHLSPIHSVILEAMTR